MRVEFLGLFSPYAHPDVQQMLARRPASPDERRHLALVRKELVKQERKRQMQGFARVQGHSSLTIGVKHGLSRDYTWGPHVWTVEMDPEDIDRLMALNAVHAQAFRVIPDVLTVRTA